MVEWFSSAIRSGFACFAYLVVSIPCSAATEINAQNQAIAASGNAAPILGGGLRVHFRFFAILALSGGCSVSEFFESEVPRVRAETGVRAVRQAVRLRACQQ